MWRPIEVRPAQWFICFRPSSPLWWVEMIPGRYKHVSAFGYVPVQKLWVFYGWTFHGTEFAVMHERHAATAIDTMMKDCLVVEYLPADTSQPQRIWWHPVNYCVSKIVDITGIPSRALRPDRFLQDCLAHGGKIVAGTTVGADQEKAAGSGEAAALSQPRETQDAR